MKNLFKFLLLLNTILYIFAFCPDYPILPTGVIPSSSPLVISSASAGISNFPSSTKQLSITIAITTGETCPSGTFNLFSMSVKPPGTGALEYFTVSVNCATFEINFQSSWFSSLTADNPYNMIMFSSSSLGSIIIFLTFDLTASFKTSFQSGIFTNAAYQTISTSTNPSFDANTKFYLCAGQNGASPRACTVSSFVLEYRFYGDVLYPFGHVAGTRDPALVAVYPLIDGSLTSSIGSAGSAYFGDSSSTPTTGTTPIWDASNNFVTISSGQFLTIPLPSLASTTPAESYSLSFFAWVKITSIPSGGYASIFSMYSADFSKVGFQLTITSSFFSPNGVELIYLTAGLHWVGSNPTVTLNQWQIIGFTAEMTTSQRYAQGTVFMGSSSYQFVFDGTLMDLSVMSVMRVGDKTGSISGISGDVSVISLTTPGGGAIRSTNLCSIDNSIELGAGSFAMSCSGTNVLNLIESKCYASCPDGTRLVTGVATSFCVPCPESSCSVCDSTQCLTCEASFILYQGGCLSSCPGGMYYDGTTCQSCPINCATCNSVHCLTCEANFVLYQGGCQGSCPGGTYSDGCSNDCSVCDSTHCLTCQANYVLYQGGCQGSCPGGMYSDGITCQSCPNDCSTCDNTHCLTCEANFLLYQGGCQSSCPGGTYSDGTACQSCPNDCSACNSAQCLSCQANFVLYQGGCQSSCPGGMYSDGITCQTCPNDCSICNSMQCFTCEANFILYQGSCQSSCPDGMYSDGTTCQNCPMHCSMCTSSSSCQACSSGYTLSNSLCIVPPSSPSSPLSPSSPSSSPSSSTSSTKIQASAIHTVASTVSAAGSAVAVGTSVIPILGLVSEVVQNTRYLNLSVSTELAEVYQTYSTDLISWDVPNFLATPDDYKPLSNLFAQYGLESPFLVNFWSTLMTMAVALGILIFSLGIRRILFKRGGSKSLLYTLNQKIIAGSLNFVITQAYDGLDNVFFYFVLDTKSNPFDNAYSRTSFTFGILFILGGIALMVFSIRVVLRYHVLKREGLAKKDMKDLEAFQEKNKYLEVFYGDFSDDDLWSHCFMAFLVLRSNASNLVFTIFYEYPLMQTLFLITMDGAIMLFMIIERPFTEFRANFFQFFFEVIALAVHFCAFLLSWNNQPSESLKKGASKAIIYLNTALVTGGLGFTLIEIHENVREKIKEWMSKKTHKNDAAVFPLPEESGVRLRNDSSPAIETRKIQIVEIENSEDTSSFQLESQRDIFKKNRYHLPAPQNRKKIRVRMKNPTFDFSLQEN